MIRKIAIGTLDDAPGVSPVAPKTLEDAPGTSKPQSAPTGGAATPASSVLKMQYAIASIHTLLKSMPLFSMNKEQGNHPFSSSIMRYVNKSSVVGMEKGQQEGSPSSLSNLVDALNVFSANGKPDGIWGKLTNNALKNLYAITQSMLYLMFKLNIKQDVYSQEDLEALKQSIPENPAELPNKTEAANAIIANITKIKALIGKFNKGLLSEHNQYSDFISSNKSYDTEYDKKYNAYSGENMNIPVLGIKLPLDIAEGGEGQVPLLLSQLSNKESFEQFLKQSNIMVDGQQPLTDPNAMNKLLAFIEAKIKQSGTQTTTDKSNQGH